MTYETIQPPFTLAFRSMTKKELGDYYLWFQSVIPERIKILTSDVKKTICYENWVPDYSPESLDTLGLWFASKVSITAKAREENEGAYSQILQRFHSSGGELTNRTFSYSIDIGMYISLVFLRNFPTVHWSHALSGKKSIDFGQPVLIGFGAVPFNPVRMMITLAYGIANRSKSGRSLREIYDYWSRQIQDSNV